MHKEFTIQIQKETVVKDVLLNDLSLALVTHLKKYDDGILLNGKKAYVNAKLKKGDVLKIKIYDEKSNIEPSNIPINILYEDDDIIVLNKERNMPTHPSQNHHKDTLANGLLYYFKDEIFTFRAITRLDKDTSGVVLVAKNPYSSHILNKDMKNKKITKEYFAVVNGVPNKNQGEINAPIKREEGTVMLRKVAPDGKEAITKYELIDENGKFSLLKLYPITGRTHQIRVHLSYIGNPIFGDDLYGAPQKGSMQLHCGCIKFYHPVTKKEMKIEAPLPCDMKKIMKI
ncbi:MAG: RluA family pseudouridine synthase [Ruminococcaceae bacterium]|nr:RluA family pseudouridine synthase [Oscillospiraceae bacterium]